MKTIGKIIWSVLILLTIIPAISQDDPWKIIGFEVLGAIIGLGLLLIWDKKVVIDDKE